METETLTAGKIPTVGGLPLYTVHTNNKGVEYKIINFNNPAVCPNTGIVEYRVIKEKTFDSRLSTKISCPVIKDPKTEIYYAIFNGFHNNGDPKWISFPLNMINVFDRSIPSEAKRALIMSKSYLTEGSPFASNNKKLVMFRLHDREKQAQDKVQKIKDSKRALNHAETLVGDNLRAVALNLGISHENMSEIMLSAEVMTRAQENPTEYLRIIEHPNFEAYTIVKRAVDTKIIDIDTHKGYTYKGTSLGHNEDFAVDFLLKHRDFMATIDMASRDALEQGKKAMEELVETKSSDNDEIAKLRKQLAEAQEKLAKKTEVVMPEGVKSDLQIELDEQLEIARGKKMKGLHLYKPTRESIDKLKEKIAEK